MSTFKDNDPKDSNIHKFPSRAELAANKVRGFYRKGTSKLPGKRDDCFDKNRKPRLANKPSLISDDILIVKHPDGSTLEITLKDVANKFHCDACFVNWYIDKSKESSRGNVDPYAPTSAGIIMSDKGLINLIKDLFIENPDKDNNEDN